MYVSLSKHEGRGIYYESGTNNRETERCCSSKTPATHTQAHCTNHGFGPELERALDSTVVMMESRDRQYCV